MADEKESLSQGDLGRLLGQQPAEPSGSQGAAQGPHQAPPAGAVNQSEIEALLDQGSGACEVGSAAATGRAPDTSPGGQEEMPRGDVEYLFHHAQQALESVDAESASRLPPDVSPFRLDELKGEPASTEMATLDLISDVQLDLKIELGRTNMYLEDVLKLRSGSVVPLDKLAGDPVDIYVNDRLIARGEVLVLNDNFCVRVGELIAGTDVGG